MKRTLLSLGLFLTACGVFAQLPPPLVNGVAYWDTTAANPNDGMRGDSVAFFFHGNGIVDSILIYGSDSNGNYSVRQRNLFFNNNAGMPDSLFITYYYSGGDYQMKYVYQYTAGHTSSLQSYFWMSGNWTPEEQINYYHSSGRLDSAITINMSGGTPQNQDRNIFYYNTGGKLTGFRADEWSGGQWDPTDSFFFTYHANGFLDSLLGYQYAGTWLPSILLKASAYETNVNELWINHPAFHYLSSGNGYFSVDAPNPEDFLYSSLIDGTRQYDWYYFTSPSTRVFMQSTTLSRVGPYEEMIKDSVAPNNVSTAYYRFYTPPTGLNKPTPETFHGKMTQTASTIEVTDAKQIVGVVITNPQGQVVWGRMTSGASTHQTVHIQHLPRGAYFLTLIYRDGRHATLSFVK